MNAVLAFLNGVGHDRHGIAGGLDSDSVSLMSTLRASYAASSRAVGNLLKSNARSSERTTKRLHRKTTAGA